MSAPLNKYKFKGIELADWGSGRFSLRKSFKKKDASEWTEHKIPTLFREELIELEKLIHEALCQPIEQSTQGKSLMDSLPPVQQPMSFDDDDINF